MDFIEKKRLFVSPCLSLFLLKSILVHLQFYKFVESSRKNGMFESICNPFSTTFKVCH
jgi:hypothetical protein